MAAQFLFSQFLSGLTTAIFLFLIASGLSLVFGVLRVLNFAHGTFYMLGAYIAWQAVQWMAPSKEAFWPAALLAAAAIALLGCVIERLMFRYLYDKEELYQLLFTYALVLILGDAAKIAWGTEQLSVTRPPVLEGSLRVLGTLVPEYNLFVMVLGCAIAVGFWVILTRTGVGRMIRAAAMDREMLGALGANVGWLYTGVFVVSSFLAGLSGALVTPIKAIVPGMDVEIIVEAFIVVVIGGLGSFWGTFLGALIYGQVLSFGILIFPRFSIFSVFALMAVILIVRPWGLLGEAAAVNRSLSSRIPWALVIFLLGLIIPWLGSRYYTFLATQIAILSLFTVSYNLLLGSAGLVSFGHAAYFGLGSYACGLLMKELGVPFVLGLAAGGLMAAAFAAVFGFFCVRLTKIYFSMLTLAFAQIIWAICFQWNELTGGDQGISGIPYPELSWLSSVPGLEGFRVGDYFYWVTLAIVILCIAALHRISVSPFGRMLTTIRENPERASFIGVNVRAYELAAFVVAGGFAGVAGALFGIFNRGVFADFLYWPKSAEVLIMTILGGMNHFWGPVVGTGMLVFLNQQITAYTEYWPLVLGSILLVLLFAFPGGLVGAIDAGLTRLRGVRGARPGA